jgi:TonB-linked SusC/RagA family outer membrane protein
VLRAPGGGNKSITARTLIINFKLTKAMQKTAIGKTMPYPPLKMLLIMKLTAILLFVALLKVNAGSTFAQSISLNVNQTPLEKVFTQIEKQSGYSFIYGKKLLQNATPVSVNVHNVSIETVLKAVFDKQPLSFTITDKYVIVSPKTTPATHANVSSPLQSDEHINELPPLVTGRILNETGEPVPGVTISIKGGKVVGITNEKGEFSLSNISDNATLLFTSVNMETKEVHLYGRKELVFTMTNKLGKLDEVVTIAYGTSSKRKNTGSVSSVTAEDIAKQPVQNPLNALEGRVAGLLISQSNGLPGSNVNILIRGANSLGNGLLPLYIIDGVPFTIQDQSVPASGALNSYGISGANNQISPFSMINPNDIERIDILKDADATAIYGTRAANGVILITTKKGQAGKTRLDINMYEGFGQVGHFVDMMNLQQYLALRHKAFANDGITPTAANAPDLFNYDTTKSTDFLRKYLGGTSNTSDMQATVSGGDLRTRFSLSANYHRETTVFPGSYSDQRATVRANVDHNSLDRKFNVTLSAMYAYDQSDLPKSDLASVVYNLPPDYPIYNNNGSLFWDANFTNPQSYFYSLYLGKSNNLIANTQLKYTVLPGLDIKTSLGFTKTSLSQNTQTPITAQNPLNSPTNNAQFATVDQQSYIVEPQLVYNKRISKGNLTVLAGTTFQRSVNSTFSLTATNYTNPNLLASIAGASSYSPGGTYTLYLYNSLFGRVTYSWQDKYIFNGNVRRDGSSRFGPNNRFGNFGSVGAAWVMSNEIFFKNISSTLSFAKLRVSYGITGNDQIQDYQYLSAYSAGSATSVYQGVSILSPNTTGNPDIHWETNKKFEVGLDLGFFKDRVLLTVNYFRNRSDNQLSYLSLPYQTGYNAYIGNFPALLQNSGLEFDFNSKNINTKNFTWKTSFNVTIPKNKLLHIDPNYFYASSYVLGHSIHQVLKYTYKGVDPTTGKPLYRNAAKDTLTFTPSYSTDRSLYGEGDPKWYGGISNDFRYKNWNLSFFIQVTKQSGNIYPSGTPGVLGNVPSFWATAGMWQNPGDNASAPKATTTTSVYSSIGSSSFTWGDNSFVKLRNVSLSYTVNSKKWLNKIKMSNLRLYAQAQNLLTLAKNKFAMDPETLATVNQSSVVTPPLRVITFGINCSF